MHVHPTISRSELLIGSSALAALVIGVPQDSLSAAEEIHKWALSEVTPASVLGPYYPLVNKPLNPNTDLISIDGKARAKGPPLYLMGQVLNIKGKPVEHVEVEIWQANAAGKYAHPSDGNTAPDDPSFKGYGVATTDAQGRYRFKTVVPGSYPVVPGWDRAPHVHFQVTGRLDRHVTQMWFPDHPLNSQDRLFLNLPAGARPMVTAKLTSSSAEIEPDAKIAVFNIIVANG